MAKGNNTADNMNRGKLTVKCPAEGCGKDMELVKAKGLSDSGMFLICPACGNRIKYTKGMYKDHDHHVKL